jgi:hypothetical protein
MSDVRASRRRESAAGRLLSRDVTFGYINALDYMATCCGGERPCNAPVIENTPVFLAWDCGSSGLLEETP